MATFSSALYALQKSDRVNTSRLPAPNQAGGGVQLATVPYAVAGTEDEATPDKINLCILPAGAIPLPGLSWVDCEDPGTALTLDIGYASNPDALADGLDLAAAGHKPFTTPAIPADALVPAPLAAADTTIYATVATGTTLTVGKILVFNIAYKLAA